MLCRIKHANGSAVTSREQCAELLSKPHELALAATSGDYYGPLSLCPEPMVTVYNIRPEWLAVLERTPTGWRFA